MLQDNTEREMNGPIAIISFHSQPAEDWICKILIFGILSMSGEQGVAVYDALRARAASSRDALLAADHARANQASEGLAMPVAALGIVFLILLATPALIRIALG